MKIKNIAFTCLLCLSASHANATTINLFSDTTVNYQNWILNQNSQAFGTTWDTYISGATITSAYETSAGSIYKLDYWVNLGGGVMNTYVNDTLINQSHEGSYWKHIKETFTAVSNQSTISFIALPSTHKIQIGPVTLSGENLNSIAAVPEPETYVLMAVGLLGLVASRKKNYKKT
jgi:hypothetical protein